MAMHVGESSPDFARTSSALLVFSSGFCLGLFLKRSRKFNRLIEGG